MRNAFLLLLLLNILAFAFQSWIIEPDDPVDAMSIDQDVPGLMLAENRKEPPSEPVVVEQASTTNPGYRCLRIGPFARETDADRVRLSLQRREATVRQTAEAGQVWVGHWAQVVNQGSRARAEAARDKLAANGIPDAYIVPGSTDNRISLGVYRKRVSADQAMRQARSLGFTARVDDRYRAGTNFWLRVRLPGDRALNPGEFKTDTGQILRTETIACADAGI
ncbi:MAG: SPOR domain-containing protein [Gammaproteobacteria bacterium]|jgi:hypothetical protein|nr:SPOR domain-containing protein [Gammaproteobacteria bacterium]MDP6616926.1 SPOR domain-containing protein [Gammaproteobacteria bacterium]MDP6696050.1 SPOR domain-containing protein [Gammaproteobacteria bacterium]